MNAYYYDDFEVGMIFDSPGRTVTETDVVMFSGISGDYNAIHTDSEYCKETLYGQRVAHGMLGLSIITGLMGRTGVFEGSAIALLGIDNWKFLKPIFIGDTIFVRFKITDKRESKSNSNTGIIHRFYELINQNGEVVQQGDMPVLVKKR